MHRTQLYIDEDVFSKVKSSASSLNISISEFIRNAINKELQQKETQETMEDFFDQLEPLVSFKNLDTSKYVESLRKNSRIINE